MVKIGWVRGMPGVNYSCLYDVLFKGPQPDDMIAIRDMGREPLTFGRLRQHIRDTVSQLNAMGFGRNDRFAVVMPAGPELLVTFLTVASGFTFVPLNLSYSQMEYERYLASLDAKALILLAGSDSPAGYAARSLGMQIIEVSPRLDLEAGLFFVTGAGAGPVSAPSFAQPEDLAMILFTAGTTASPKMVPFTHRRLCLSISLFAENNAHLRDPEACNICIMPMFHLQGIIFPISSLAVGVSMACTPALSVPLLIEYLQEFRPGWFSGGPPVLQGLLDYGNLNSSFSLSKSISHFVCSGAQLSPQLVNAFEARFGLPVTNSYWMSECMMISNNSPAKARAKPGSVGTPGSSEIRFISDTGMFLGPGEAGEIVVRGPLVITGYLNNPGENAASFLDGWFRTGDMGYLGPDGYLFITGRCQERINKGGEKVSPGEVEEVLLSHPAVAEAVVFPVPDPALGENIGAAVVLKRGMTLRPGELKRHVSSRLAYFKVPAQLWMVDSIPAEPTGKVRRISLYEKLKNSRTPVEGHEALVTPATPVEESLAKIWAEVLGVGHIGRGDSFFDLGGDSLKAVRLVTLIKEQLKVTLPIGVVITAPTLLQMAKAISDGQTGHEPRYIVALQRDGHRPPVYCFSTVHGALSEYYPLVRNLGTDQPVYGFISPGLDGVSKTPRTVGEAASLYIREIRELQPHGPYCLLGYCAGGVIAYEAACQLESGGEPVGFLGIIDIKSPGDDPTRPLWYKYRFIKDNAGGAMLHCDNFWRADVKGKIRTIARAPGFFVNKAMRLTGEAKSYPILFTPQSAATGEYPEWIENCAEPQRSVSKINTDAIKSYVPKPYGGNIVVFISSEQVRLRKLNGKYDVAYGWKKLTKGRVRRHIIEGDHGSIINPESSKSIAQVIRREISHCKPVNGSRR
jgi:oxalate---CoA ligase